MVYTPTSWVDGVTVADATKLNKIEQGIATVDTQSSTETIRDTIAAALIAGTNMTVTVNDPGDTITLSSTGGGATDAEVVRDTIATALVAGTNMTVVVDDAANTITLASVGSTDPEVVRDTIASALVGGTNISIVTDDTANTITVNMTATLGTAAALSTGTASGNIPVLSTGGRLPIARIASGTPNGIQYVRDDGVLATPSGADPEFIRDTMATALVGGTGVTITPDDATDIITISSTGGADLTGYGVRPTLYYTGSTWPARTLPSGYTGPVQWDSADYTGVATPTAAINGDRVIRRKDA